MLNLASFPYSWLPFSSSLGFHIRRLLKEIVFQMFKRSQRIIFWKEFIFFPQVLNEILIFLSFLDTFQALIQYPDVVTAQAAKLVRNLLSYVCFYSVNGVASARFVIQECLVNLYSIFCHYRRWTVRIFTTHAAHSVSSILSWAALMSNTTMTRAVTTPIRHCRPEITA